VTLTPAMATSAEPSIGISEVPPRPTPPQPGHLMATPLWVDFYDTQVGQTAFGKYVTVQNSGPGDVTNLFVNSSCFSQFQVMGFCPSTLHPLGSCTLDISFRPYHEGYDSCNITFSGSGAAYESVQVTGTGVPAPKPQENATANADL
jgi:hypothetical protein